MLVKVQGRVKVRFPFLVIQLEMIFGWLMLTIKIPFLGNFPFRKLHSKVDFGLLMSAIKTSSFGISFLGLYAGLAYSNGLEKSLNSPMALKYHRQKCFMI